MEELEPTSNEIKATISAMSERGIRLVYGRWLVEGAPRVLLIDTSTGYQWLDEWKNDLWSVARIPSPPDDNETNEAIVFGYLVAWFLGEVCTRLLACNAPGLLPSSLSFPLPSTKRPLTDRAHSLSATRRRKQ